MLLRLALNVQLYMHHACRFAQDTPSSTLMSRSSHADTRRSMQGGDVKCWEFLKPAAHCVTGISVCLLHHEIDLSCNRLHGMYGGGGGKTLVVACRRSHRSGASFVPHSQYGDTCDSIVTPPVMAYLYANYVRYGYSMQMQEGKNAPGSTHGLSITYEFCTFCTPTN